MIGQKPSSGFPRPHKSVWFLIKRRYATPSLSRSNDSEERASRESGLREREGFEPTLFRLSASEYLSESDRVFQWPRFSDNLVSEVLNLVPSLI